jgi:hypothetical protein
LEKALDDMEDYNNYLIEAQEILEEIFEGTDYQKKRIAKIKQQIIRYGLQISPKKVDNTNLQTSKMDVTERAINLLITYFPELAKDYPLLEKHGFMEKTEKGLRRKGKRSKKFLTDYFKSIQPQKMKKIPWKTIGNIFDEEHLKNSSSRNGNAFKKPLSEDFKEWQKIKNASIHE